MLLAELVQQLLQICLSLFLFALKLLELDLQVVVRVFESVVLLCFCLELSRDFATLGIRVSYLALQILHEGLTLGVQFL